MTMLSDAVRTLGIDLKKKLNQPVISGDPEDQLRTPLDAFLRALAKALGLSDVNVIGEVQMADINSRPDFAVTVGGALTGFVEVKALGKGADPRSYRGHDKDQFARLSLLPNVLYTDGQSWSLWQNGELVHHVGRLDGDIAVAGAELVAGEWLEAMMR
ncbi:hypothetical protein [Microbacterium flavum]|uniref:Restriction endonuclease n=1 Tax=Microbacterium flavum TaxID=415216 RepID=A0ABS5XV53_9MICO|nr:hypothetical protein [Microbacterium flavum]MBT8798417.1 hypothetical protein [Microbacterium flavum]